MFRQLLGLGTFCFGRRARLLCGTMMAISALATGACAADSANLLSNGGFENGTSGWGWEQWDNKPLPGAIDSSEHPEGSASFRFGLPGATGGRWIAQEVKVPAKAKDYKLTFMAKGEKLAAAAARMRVGIEGRGFLGSASGVVDLMKEGDTFPWQKYEVTISAAELGDSGKMTLFFYDDQVGQGSLWIDGVSVSMESAPVATTPAAAAEPEDNANNMLDNGGFEAGVDGWQWEQWENKPLPGALDTKDRIRGSASFKMGVAGGTGGRWMGKEIKLTKPGQDYVLSFWLKPTDLPPDAAYVRLGIDGSGWLGTAEGKSDIVRIGGSGDWKHYTVPVPADRVGQSTKASLFFYHDQLGKGTLGIDAVSFKPATAKEMQRAAAAGVGPVLTGDTNRPTNSTFAVGEKVELTFRLTKATELKPPLSLALDIVDEHDQPVESKSIPVAVDAEGDWQTTVTAPTPRLGFYRVHAKLSDGTPLAALGTRPSGMLTYIIVPDPSKRIDYGDAKSRFAMQGAWQADICSMLGVRWVLDDSLNWDKMEPDHAGQFGPEEIKKFADTAKPGGSSFRVEALPTLYKFTKWGTVPSTAVYMTGTLTPEGEKAWGEYCKAAARAFIAKYPQSKHRVYQITWEPIQPWGFKGTNADLVRIYEVAYPALHEADPDAIVAGPCRGLYNNGDPGDTESLLKAGLAKYIDGYAVHAYHSETPERDGMPQSIRNMKQILRSTTGKEIPMYGTEQGLPTDEDISKEVPVARALLRQNLIALGEGFQFNFAFTLYDYRMEGSRTGYGYYYNLVPGVPFGPSKMCPKALAAAYAAQSMLLEGSNSAGAIEWLGNRVWGYAFERPDATILALWSYGSQPVDVSIPTGARQVQVYDWMGNQRSVNTAVGVLTLKLGPEPVYVSGVSPQLWGSEAAKLLTVDSKQLKLYPGQHATVAGKAMMPADKPLQASLVIEDPDGVMPPVSRQVSVGGGTAAGFEFDLEVLPKMAVGPHTLHLRLRNSAGETLTATTLGLEVLSPVAISTSVAFTPEGKPALAVVLEEKQGRSVTGQLEVSLKELIPGADRGDAPMIDLVADPGKSKDVPGASRQLSFELTAHQSKRLLVDFGDASIAPARRYESLLKLTTDKGTTVSQTTPAHFLGASHLEKPITIDGDLSDWPAMTPVTLTGPKDVIRSPQYFPGHLTARLRYAWDAQALYLSAEVDDDIFVQERTGANIWSHDCLQLAFNLDAQPRTGPEANTVDRRTMEINVALTAKGPEAFRSTSSSEEKRPVGPLTPEQLHLAIKKSDGGKLKYELAIPWTTLGLKPGETLKSGDAIGVAVAVNEVRSAAQQDPTALGLFGGITDKNPDKNGTLTLR